MNELIEITQKLFALGLGLHKTLDDRWEVRIIEDFRVLKLCATLAEVKLIAEGIELGITIADGRHSESSPGS